MRYLILIFSLICTLAFADGINFAPNGKISMASGASIIFLGAAPIGSAPIAGFIGIPTNGTDPLTVTFTDLSSNTPTSWQWYFGDSSATTTQNPTHEYIATGVYTVSLYVSNVYGNDTATKTNYITVTSSSTPDEIWLNASMTSQNTPPPYEVLGPYAFNIWVWLDHDLNTSYEAPSNNDSIGYNFGSAKTVTRLKIQNVLDNGIQNWTLYGGNSWPPTDSLATGIFANNESLQEVAISNSMAYQYYRLNWTSTYNGSTAEVCELEFWGY